MNKLDLLEYSLFKNMQFTISCALGQITSVHQITKDAIWIDLILKCEANIASQSLKYQWQKNFTCPSLPDLLVKHCIFLFNFQYLRFSHLLSTKFTLSEAVNILVFCNTLESGINIGVGLFIFEHFSRGYVLNIAWARVN
jgi:hypothetical protein